MLTANDTLDLILHELGASAYRQIEPPFTPDRVQRTVSVCRDVSVFAALVDDEDDAESLCDLLQSQVGGVSVTPVDEGFLVVAYRPTLPQRRPPARSRRLLAWTTPDARPVAGSTDADLSQPALKRWLERATTEERRQVPRVGSNADQQLGSWGLLALDGVVWRPTVAAMVLGGVRPEVFMPACRLRGEVDGVPVDLRGSVGNLLRGLGRQLERRHRGLVMHVVRHALLHRDWSCEEPVAVELVRGRLTVSYPGRLGGQSSNPLLLHLAAELGLGAGTQGLSKVDATLKRARLPRASLFEQDGWVRFVADLEPPRRRRRSLPTREASDPLEGERVEAASVEPPPPVEAEASPPSLVAPTLLPPPPALLPRDPEDRANAVLAILARGRASTREVAAAMGCSRPVIGKVLTALVAEGRVRKIATSPRSPFQAYEVAADAGPC